jgi:uncharacterized protein
MTRGGRVGSFYAVTFLLTHALALGYLLSGGSFRRLDSFVFANAAMMVPGLVAVCLTRFVFREPVGRTLGLSLRFNRWFLFAWWFPPLLSLAALLIGLSLPGTSYSRQLAGLSARFELSAEQLRGLAPQIGSLPPIASLLVQGLLLGPTLSAIAGLGEEAGWRGLLHHDLRALGFWQESWIVGALWGVWHLPLVFEGYGFPNQPIAGACVLLAFTLLAAPLYTLVRLRADSTLACAIFHGSFGATMLLTFAPVAGGNELTVGLLALPGVLLLAGANVVIACLPARYRA